MRRAIPVVLFVLCLWLSATPATANTVLAGNTAGNPAATPPIACPKHPGNVCWSELVPKKVQLLSDCSAWFKGVLGAEYKAADGWKFNYMDGNDNMKGKFFVDTYKAYDDCAGRMGAEIRVRFIPDADSLIKDVLWVSAYSESWPGHAASEMDDRDRLPPAKQPGAMFGPFYPFQDEDQDPPRWQTDYQYDQFYDKPGDPCPTPYTVTSLRFETYATWWDDYYNADGTITDVGNDGHNVYFHEGFKWGYDLHCVPEPLTMAGLFLGLAGVGGYLRRRQRM